MTKKKAEAGWNKASYEQRIKALEKQLKEAKARGSNVENAERKAASLENQLAEMKETLEKARPLLQENNRLRAKLRAGEGAAEIITEILSGLMEERPRVIKVSPPQILGGVYRPEEENVAVAHLSDLHLGKITPSFDSKIAVERLREYGRKVTRCLKVHNAAMGVQDLRVYMTGDMVEGEQIFAHQAHEIDSSVFEQACFTCPEALAEIIASWASVFERVRVVAVPGNHGRNGPKKGPANPRTNWDRVCYRVLGMLLKSVHNVEIVAPDSFYAVDDVLGSGNLLVHGDQVRGGFAGFPWYGVGRKALGWIDSIPEPWRNLFLGHFHTPVAGRFSGRWWFANGTLESSNEFARSEMASAGTPAQRLTIFNKKHGPIVDLMINLTAGL